MKKLIIPYFITLIIFEIIYWTLGHKTINDAIITLMMVSTLFAIIAIFINVIKERNRRQLQEYWDEYHRREAEKEEMENIIANAIRKANDKKDTD